MATSLPGVDDSDFSEEEQTPLDSYFSQASNHVRKITSNLNNDQLLQLYGLYKQSTDGKCSTPKPGWFDGKGRKKWEAWSALGDMSRDEAKEKYISLVSEYDPSYAEFTENSNTPKEAWVAVSSLRYSPEPDLVPTELSLIDAAREDCSERIIELLSKNPELKEVKDEDGLTALHWAADRDSTKALLACIKGGCPIDAVDDCGQTALHYAVSCGHLKSTQILVDAGAALLKDDEGNTPLNLATDADIKKLLEDTNI